MLGVARKSLRAVGKTSRSFCTSTTRYASVALVGSPNAGKSTIVNHLVGSKVQRAALQVCTAAPQFRLAQVVATSSKSNTTRAQFNGVLTEENIQLVLRDVPGFVNPRCVAAA